VALAGAWLLVVAVGARARERRIAALSAVLVGLHLLVAVRPQVAPVVLAGWFGYGLALPGGRLVGRGRRLLAGAAALGAVTWAGVLVARYATLSAAAAVTLGLVLAGCAGLLAAVRCRSATCGERAVLQWHAAAGVLVVAVGAVVLALHVLVGLPESSGPWLAAALVLVPVAAALALGRGTGGLAEAALAEAVVVAGLAVLVVGVYLVVVVGLNRSPQGGEREIMLASLVAALVAAVLAQPVRHRLAGLAAGLAGRRDASAEEVVAGFGARMSRAVPMDELMLQLTESLRESVAPAGAEIWVGTDGVLARSVAVPSRPVARLVLGEQERVVVARARIGGPSWTSVWLADLVDGANLRVTPVAHLGELLGLIVCRRASADPDFTEDDDRLLVDLARQLGLALHNVRLDSALQASLEELEQRNAELQASRLRIVTAGDESRRLIERNLHDGAQQHLVALAVTLGLAGTIAEEDPEELPDLLEKLREDVRTTIAELRELAHGIYPPLLRDRGLSEALGAAALRSPLSCHLEVALPGRYPEAVETAAYFCCLEAMQNAGKHAGDGANLTVRVTGTDGTLCFEVADDGAGFDLRATAGHGFVNMRDRLGALGGTLTVESKPGDGARIRGTVPAVPLPEVSPRPRSATAAG
jgi:signal transduction histidine kinase